MATTLPANAAQYESYFNANLKGDGTHAGTPSPGISQWGFTGSTIGAQWMSFYAQASGKYGAKYTITQYAQAFVVLFEEAQTGSTIAGATAATGTVSGDILSGIGKGISQLNSQSGGTLAAAGNVWSSITSWQQAFGDITGALTSSALWIRIIKVIGGGILLIVGAAHISGFDKGIIGKAVAAAPLLA